MRCMVLATILAAVTACAGNKTQEEDGSRIRDTALTAEDSISPSDTLDRARRVVPDSAVGPDTTATR
jgi:hypothetical protein